MNKDKIFEALHDVCDKVHSFWHDYFVHPYYSVKRGVTNLVMWFPVIWKDRPWDNYFIYKIIHKKIELTECYTNKMASYRGFEADTKNMRDVREALERLIEDDYVLETTKHIDERFGELDMIFGEEDERGRTSLTIQRKNVDYDNPEEVALERRMTKEAYLLAEENKQKDIALVFDTMKDHIEGWWE